LVLQCAEDYLGATRLQEFIEQQRHAFDDMLAKVRMEAAGEDQKQTDEIVAFEIQAHDRDWAAMRTAVQHHYQQKLVRAPGMGLSIAPWLCSLRAA
jgi:hydrogenase maturation factor HypF (carbamoyltransferase family)